MSETKPAGAQPEETQAAGEAGEAREFRSSMSHLGAVEGENMVEPVIPLHEVEEALRRYFKDDEHVDEIVSAILADLTPGD